jgi:hypothetical protein
MSPKPTPTPADGAEDDDWVLVEELPLGGEWEAVDSGFAVGSYVKLHSLTTKRMNGVHAVVVTPGFVDGRWSVAYFADGGRGCVAQTGALKPANLSLVADAPLPDNLAIALKKVEATRLRQREALCELSPAAAGKRRRRRRKR